MLNDLTNTIANYVKPDLSKGYIRLADEVDGFLLVWLGGYVILLTIGLAFQNVVLILTPFIITTIGNFLGGSEYYHLRRNAIREALTNLDKSLPKTDEVIEAGKRGEDVESDMHRP